LSSGKKRKSVIFLEKSGIFLGKIVFCGEKHEFTTFFRVAEKGCPKGLFAKVSQKFRKTRATMRFCGASELKTRVKTRIAHFEVR